MKPSELMLKGFAMAGGRQCVGEYASGDASNPTAVCALGAIRLWKTGNATASCDASNRAEDVFFRVTGALIFKASDDACKEQTEPMCIDDIAGILAAEGV